MKNTYLLDFGTNGESMRSLDDIIQTLKKIRKEYGEDAWVYQKRSHNPMNAEGDDVYIVPQSYDCDADKRNYV